MTRRPSWHRCQRDIRKACYFKPDCDRLQSKFVSSARSAIAMCSDIDFPSNLPSFSSCDLRLGSLVHAAILFWRRCFDHKVHDLSLSIPVKYDDVLCPRNYYESCRAGHARDILLAYHSTHSIFKEPPLLNKSRGYARYPVDNQHYSNLEEANNIYTSKTTSLPSNLSIHILTSSRPSHTSA
jgi:hypothetical protein